MAQEFDNTNRGTLWLESPKKNPKGPDFTGKLDVDGRELRIVAWKRTTKDGSPMLSLSVEDPQAFKNSRPAGNRPAPAPRVPTGRTRVEHPGTPDPDDDLPW